MNITTERRPLTPVGGRSRRSVAETFSPRSAPTIRRSLQSRGSWKGDVKESLKAALAFADEDYEDDYNDSANPKKSKKATRHSTTSEKLSEEFKNLKTSKDSKDIRKDETSPSMAKSGIKKAQRTDSFDTIHSKKIKGKDKQRRGRKEDYTTNLPPTSSTSSSTANVSMSRGTKKALKEGLKMEKKGRRDSFGTIHAKNIRKREHRQKEKEETLRSSSKDISPCLVERRPSLDDFTLYDDELLLNSSTPSSPLESSLKKLSSKLENLPDMGDSASRLCYSPGCLKKKGISKNKSFGSSSSGSVRFSDVSDTKEIDALEDSLASVMFYDSEEIGRFRNEAFLETCGLNPEEFADM